MQYRFDDPCSNCGRTFAKQRRRRPAFCSVRCRVAAHRRRLRTKM